MAGVDPATGAPVERLVSVDLGQHRAGLALFRHGVLVHGTEVYADGHGPLGAQNMAYAIANACAAAGFPLPSCPAVAEAMVDREGKPARTGRLGRLRAVWEALAPLAAGSRAYKAEEWKRSTTKQITRRRVIQALSVAEAARVSSWLAGPRFEVSDAIGIGLVHLRRLRPGLRKNSR